MKWIKLLPYKRADQFQWMSYCKFYISRQKVIPLNQKFQNFCKKKREQPCKVYWNFQKFCTGIFVPFAFLSKILELLVFNEWFTFPNSTISGFSKTVTENFLAICTHFKIFCIFGWLESAQILLDDLNLTI